MADRSTPKENRNFIESKNIFWRSAFSRARYFQIFTCPSLDAGLWKLMELESSHDEQLLLSLWLLQGTHLAGCYGTGSHCFFWNPSSSPDLGSTCFKRKIKSSISSLEGKETLKTWINNKHNCYYHFNVSPLPTTNHKIKSSIAFIFTKICMYIFFCSIDTSKINV